MLKDNSFPVLGKSNTENACQHLSGGRFMMRPGTKSEKRLENSLHTDY